VDGSADTIVNMTLEERCVVLSKTVVSRLGHFLILDSGEGGLGLVANQVAQVGCCLLFVDASFSSFSFFSSHYYSFFQPQFSLSLPIVLSHNTSRPLSGMLWRSRKNSWNG